jgi:lipopolysaccharide export LptBFGC system permease protein LptF
MRIPPNEVKIELGSQILLPNGRRIPILSDGSTLINPNAARRARHLRANQLLLVAQQREDKVPTTGHLDNLGDDILLARVVPGDEKIADPLAATIATIQANSFVRRVSWIFDCTFILLLVAVSGIVRRFSRIDIVLLAIAITAAYCLSSLALVGRWAIWLPGVLPLSATWLVAVFCLFAPRSKNDPDLPAIAPSPPAP